MSANEERRVKARYDVTQFYQRKKDVSRREIPRGVMTISGDPNSNNSSSSSDDDIKDDTYAPSLRARPHKNGWLVQVAAGQGEIMKLRKRLRKGLMVMMVKRKKMSLM
jgi:hypothetical protein